MGDPQSLNRYSYVSNDPVNRVDPSGLMEQICYAQGKCYPWEPPVATAYSGVDTVSLFGNYFTPASRSGGRNWFYTPLRPLPAGDETDARHTPRRGGNNNQPQRQYAEGVSPEQSRQQKGFDDCAKQALGTWRKAYLGTGLKAAGAGILIGGGIHIMRSGLPGVGWGAPGIAHAMKDASLNGLGKTMTTMLEVKDTIWAAGFPIITGGGLAAQTVTDQRNSDAVLRAAMEDCKKQFPGAPWAFMNTRVVFGL